MTDTEKMIKILTVHKENNLQYCLDPSDNTDHEYYRGRADLCTGLLLQLKAEDISEVFEDYTWEEERTS